LLLAEFQKIGYEPYYAILNSANFGVPQSRKRVYIVAFRQDLEAFHFQFPPKTSKVVSVKSIIIEGDNSIPISDKWQTYIDLYQNKISLADISFEVPKTRTQLERMDKDVDLSDCIFQMRSSGIRALAMNKPFPTLAVSVSGGGAMIPVYSKERRHLSLREMARIMGFEDNFQFPVSRTYAIKQLANAVCPLVITAIGKSIIDKIEFSTVENLPVCEQV
jgi:DNA (cytosine-5)-methyltransferase 1